MDEREYIIKGIKKFVKKVNKDFHIEKIILFGSRAGKKYFKDSDVDIIIVSDNFKGLDFFERVSKMYSYWELDYADSVQTVFFYFDPDTLSPISLLELGLQARGNRKGDFDRVLVCCPPGFWRYGNVDQVCKRHGIQLFDHLEDAILDLRTRIELEGRAVYPWGLPG